MKLTGITWITTYNCNLACDHCFFETKGEKKYMNPDLVEDALSSLKNARHMFWQHLSGGEIFLDEERLFQIIVNIRKYFKKDIGLSTNAFWAKDYSTTLQKVNKLGKLGVTGIAISADHYHQEHMLTTGPKILAKAVRQIGLNTHSYLMGARLNADVLNAAEINEHTEAITNEINLNLNLPLAFAVERSIGKGSRINSPKKKEIPDGGCTELNTCLGERSPFNPAMVWIDPYGNVMICYGIKIGNLYKKSLKEIVEEYTPKKYSMINVLASKGPKGLHQIAKEEGFNVASSFYDKCDICYQSRFKLRNNYFEEFGPDECYPE